MNIVFLDNVQMTSRNGRLYCVTGTGKFAKELVDLGNDVTMFGQKIEDLGSIADFDIEANGIKTISYWRTRLKILDYLKLYWNALREAFKNDFVYIYYPTSYKYFALLCWLTRRKYGLYIRGTVGVKDRVSQIIYKHASAIFCVSQVFTDFVNEVNPKQIAHTIRPMIDLTEKDAVERSYLMPTSFSVLMFCRIEKEKGIVELLNAVKQLKSNNKNQFSLVVAGGGGFLDEAKRLVETLNIKDVVRFTGAVNDKDEKRQLFLDSDIYILPTYHEGFPRTLYEAMLYGTPIVTTMVGGIPAVMKDGLNCKSIEPKSEKSIVAGLSFAFNHYDKMISYAKQGAQSVIKIVDSNRPSHAQDVNNAIQHLK